MRIHLLVLSFVASGITVSATPSGRQYEKFKSQTNDTLGVLQIDLGYEIYEGVANSSNGLNMWKGIRYAAPPTGNMRWQAPKIPTSNRSSVISADEYPDSCPQSSNAGTGFAVTPVPISEDCLFLNVWAPQNASGLPVFVWIHGGGYGTGNGRDDPSHLINANGNQFVGISIQYRLGAFGFLAGDEVYRNGVVNAGILDQVMALKWIQSYVELFGGDPKQVTIGGISAGAGSVMLLDIASNGELGSTLFANSFSASPFLPQQYGYKDWIPSQSYYAFATAAGCPPQGAYGNTSQTIFECLVSQDSETLQDASQLVSTSGIYGTWGFLPVTDGELIQQRPSEALLKGKVNGVNHLSGNNAEEAFYFVNPNITTITDLVDWIRLVFPLFKEEDIANVLSYYPSSNISDADSSLIPFATSGDKGATAVNVSQAAIGQQQRAYNIYAETVFVCPSYWLAEAYSSNGQKGYKYQYSVPNAAHGSDQTAYFANPTAPNQSPDFVLAFQTILGNFITTGNPSINSSIANGANANSTSESALADWPMFTASDLRMVNLNTTGGTEFATSNPVVGLNFAMFMEPGLRNDLEVVDGGTWEGGRAERCEFWRSVGSRVPE